MRRRHDELKVGRLDPPPVCRARLRLKPKAPHSGYVDGAWWPRTDDLTRELPDLLAVMSVRLGVIDRVVYNLNEWAKVPAKLATGGRTVRLSGYRLQPINTLEILGVNRDKIVLLVVPPDTEPDHAHATMMAAAGPDNASTVVSLLTEQHSHQKRPPESASVSAAGPDERRVPIAGAPPGTVPQLRVQP